MPQAVISQQEDAMFAATLTTLRKNRERIATNQNTYYDQAKDQQDKDQYYREINWNADAKSLFQQLNARIRRGYVSYSYSQSRRELYAWVDLHPNGKLRSIYSGQEHEPENVLSEDQEIDKRRIAAFEQVLRTNPTLTQTEKKAQIARIKANFPHNCEHVVPQSWFDKQLPMKSDLHHLFTCEVTCNSQRSNYPYEDFPDYNPDGMGIQSTTPGCGKEEGKEFEPEASKGVVARATLYFLLRYLGKIPSTKVNIPILLEWHKKYPVDLFEKHRNQSIYQLQNNRNPFIDFPEYAEQIDLIQALQ